MALINLDKRLIRSYSRQGTATRGRRRMGISPLKSSKTSSYLIPATPKETLPEIGPPGAIEGWSWDQNAPPPLKPVDEPVLVPEIVPTPTEMNEPPLGKSLINRGLVAAPSPVSGEFAWSNVNPAPGVPTADVLGTGPYNPHPGSLPGLEPWSPVSGLKSMEPATDWKGEAKNALKGVGTLISPLGGLINPVATAVTGIGKNVGKIISSAIMGKTGKAEEMDYSPLADIDVGALFGGEEYGGVGAPSGPSFPSESGFGGVGVSSGGYGGYASGDAAAGYGSEGGYGAGGWY